MAYNRPHIMARRPSATSSLSFSLRARPLLWLYGLLLAFGSGSFAPPCYSQSYEQGYNEYVRGNFAGAERALEGALVRSPSLADKARIFKMLGISQYMQGKRLEAEESFSQAKKANPKIRISPSEVLDESVIDFFSSIPVPAGPPPQEPPSRTPSSSWLDESRGPDSQEGCYLQVISNIKDAYVYIDGRLAGTSDGLIEVEPGQHEVSIVAKGFSKVSQSINLVPQRTNRLQVDFKSKAAKGGGGEDNPSESSKAEAKASEAAASRHADLKAKRLKRDKERARDFQEQQAAIAARKSKKKRHRGEGNEPSPPPAGGGGGVPGTTYLPFGVPQFLGERWLVGGVVASTQGAGLLYNYMTYKKANKLVDSTNTYISQRTLAEASVPTLAERQNFHDETVRTVAANNKQISNLRLYGYLSLTLAGLAWVGGAWEAHSAYTGEAQARARRQAHYPSPTRNLQLTQQGSNHLWPNKPRASYSWTLLPAQAAMPAAPRDGFVLDFRLNF